MLPVILQQEAPFPLRDQVLEWMPINPKSHPLPCLLLLDLPVSKYIKILPIALHVLREIEQDEFNHCSLVFIIMCL